jgi:hypothetical protein
MRFFLTQVFSCFFFFCKANATVNLAKTGHGPHSSKLVVIYVVLCVVLRIVVFVLFYVLFVFVLFYVLLVFVLFYVFFVFVLLYVLFVFVLFYVLLVFVSFCVLFVCKCVLYHCHRMLTQLQLTNVI